MAKTSIYI